MLYMIHLLTVCESAPEVAGQPVGIFLFVIVQDHAVNGRECGSFRLRRSVRAG